MRKRLLNLKEKAKGGILGFMTFLSATLVASSSSAQTVYDVIANSTDHDTLEIAINLAGLAPALQDPTASLTVFAPTDEAFAALDPTTFAGLIANPMDQLDDILLYHVIGDSVPASALSNGLFATTLNSDSVIVTIPSAGDPFVNQAVITVTDIPATNGTVHVIDAVLLPGNTLVDVAIQNGFSTLATAVVAAELVPALVDPASELTVFAPTNEAFAEIQSTVDALLAGPIEDLQTVLLYHVIGEEVPSSALVDDSMVPTLQGESVMIDLTGGVFVNDASVLTPNVDAQNGIAHVINKVLVPAVVGLEDEVSANEFSIYPNPVVNSANVNLVNQKLIGGTITLMSTDGTTISTQAISDQSNSVPTAELTPGTYIIEVSNGSQRASLKIVK